MRIVMVILALLVLAAGGLFGLQQYQQNQDLQAQIAAMQLQIADLQGQVNDLNGKIYEVEQQSVSGVVKQANERVRDGIKSMFRAAEEEFQRLQDTLDNTLDELQKPYDAYDDPALEQEQKSGDSHST